MSIIRHGLGLDAVQAAGRTWLAALSGSASRTAALVRQVARPGSSDLPPLRIADPAARFEADAARTGADLPKIMRNTARQFWLYAALALAALAAGFSDPVTWFAVPLLAALGFRAGYTNFMVRERSYASPARYLAAPSAWLPR